LITDIDLIAIVRGVHSALGRGGPEPAMTLKSALSRLPIDSYLLLLAAMVALAWVLPVKGAAATAAADVVHAVVAALFFFYGARLSREAVIAGVSHWRLQATVFLSTYLLFPLIGLALNAVVQGRMQPDISTGLLYLCLLPSTVQSAVAFTAVARGNLAAAVCSASFSNLIGVFITPALVAIAIPSASGGFSLKALLDIATQILVPFALGQLARPWLVSWLQRNTRLMVVIDRGSILLVVYTAFSAGMAAGIWTRVSGADIAVIVALDFALLSTLIAAMIATCRVLKFSVEDETAIVFCGSNKSLAAGIPMATVLFAGHAVSLIVLPLMLFHQVQLFACSLLARRYAKRPLGGPSPAVTQAP
jgi:sodium/bile acid cotransporter 7